MKKTLPTGEKFLPHTSMGELEKLYKKETDPKAGERLPACMARKGGRGLQKIGKNPCRPHSTMRSRMLRAADGLHDARRPGPARGPAAEQPAELKGDPAAGPQAQGPGPGPWTGKLAAGRPTPPAGTGPGTCRAPCRSCRAARG